MSDCCQAKAFLQAYHQVRLTRTAKLVEDEQWSQAEVSPELQHITGTILDCAVLDSPELVIKHEDPLWSPPPSATLSTSEASESTDSVRTLVETNSHSQPAQPTPISSTKQLRIDDRTYFVVSATVEVLALLQDYLRLVINLSLLTTDTMSRVIEFLKAFNSRTCQVVLGAGAMRSAGLKNITAKHLC
jgi:vacuolar protein sorting-associated protein 54